MGIVGRREIESKLGFEVWPLVAWELRKLKQTTRHEETWKLDGSNDRFIAPCSQNLWEEYGLIVARLVRRRLAKLR